MGLEDFERELAAANASASKPRSHRTRDEVDRDRRDRHHRHHHHRSHKHRRREDEGHDNGRSRHDQRRRSRSYEAERRQHKRRRSQSPKRELDVKPEEAKTSDSDDGQEEEWVEKEAMSAPPQENILDQMDHTTGTDKPQRDSWMQEPGALDIDYVQRRRPKEPEGQFVSAKRTHDLNIHHEQTNSHLADLRRDFESDNDEDAADAQVEDVPAQHEVPYTFGDSGSAWRLTKLKNVYRQAEEAGRPVDEIALERFGNLRDFDDAREEEREMDRRKMYGKDYVGLQKPSGELYQERKLQAGLHRGESTNHSSKELKQAAKVENPQPISATLPLDSTSLNKLKAEMLKARMRNAPNAAQLEKEYDIAANASMANRVQPDVVVLNQMENRQLASGRDGEVTRITNKRGRERGLVEENEDMSIEDMVRQERRTRGIQGGEGRAFAERIAKDSKFKDDLEYMDDNAAILSKRVIKGDVNLRNTAISDFTKMQRILDSCPLCYHEDTNKPPIAPVVSLATRTYLTLPTEPEVARNGAVIVPIQHRLNLLECDDDEWEEIRNFMKSLTRFYHAQNKSVIFYENAAYASSRKGHAALNAIPLPHHLAETAPAYFKEAVLASDEQWAQHKPIIDTMALAQRPGYGKAAFRKAIPKEMPYFHVFFSLDGGLGHVVEDERRWPKGDLFAREVIGGMLDRGPEVIKKQGRWEKGDRRLEGFRKKWADFDWTAALMNAA